MARGNGGRHSRMTRTAAVPRLARRARKTGWRIYAYVLMSNHYHLPGHGAQSGEWHEMVMGPHSSAGRHQVLNLSGRDKA
jgi:hypothetical protein